MEAVFKARSFIFLSAVMLVSGGAFAFFGISGLTVENPEIPYAVFLITVGLILVSISCVYFLYNKGAFLKIKDGKITAAYGINKTLSVSYGDVEKATLGCDLIVFHLKNGKKAKITGLLNAHSVYVYVSETLFGTVPLDLTKPKAEMLGELRKLKKQGVTAGIFIALPALVIAAAVIFDIVFAKKLPEEQKEICFWCSLAVVFLMFAVTYFFIRTFQFNGIKVQEKEMELRSLAFLKTPAPDGMLIGAYRDGEYTFRLCVFGYPNSTNVYCTLEEFDDDFSFVVKLKSPVFSRIERLKERFANFDSLIKINI